MGLRRQGLKSLAATFAAVKPSASSLIETSSPDKENLSSLEHEPLEFKKSTSQPLELPSISKPKIDPPARGSDMRVDRSAFSRANKIYQSFTAGVDRSNSYFGGDLGIKRRRDDERIDKVEQDRILNIIEQEESSDEEEDSSDEDSAVEQTSRDLAAADNQGKVDSDSLCSGSDILNRSLGSDAPCEDKACDPENFLRYVSEKYGSNLDVLQVVDKNERSFKQVAEKMIQQTRQLEVPVEIADLNTAKRGTSNNRSKLMEMKLFKKISDRFFGESEVA